MEKLNKSDILKIKVLKQYKKKEIYYTASYLSKILKSKFETMQKALEFFYNMGILEKDIREHGVQKYTYYYLTEIGKNLIKSRKI